MKSVAIDDRGLIRLVSASHYKPPILRGLADSETEAEFFAELEGATSARLVAERGSGLAQARRDLAFARRAHDMKLYGQTHINAAFAYRRKSGNRFSDPDQGAWYCSYDVLTSAEEVRFHRTRELCSIGRYEDETRYVELLADVTGIFPDLDGYRDHPGLNPDPDIGYSEGPTGQFESPRRGGNIHHMVGHYRTGAHRPSGKHSREIEQREISQVGIHAFSKHSGGQIACSLGRTKSMFATHA